MRQRGFGAQRMPATAARLRAAGLPIEAWTGTAVAGALGTRAYTAGLYDPHGGQVHPGKLVALWKRAAEQAGVRIYEHAPDPVQRRPDQRRLCGSHP